MEAVTLFGNAKSNAFWGNRSGAVHKDGSNCFTQRQFGSGSSGNRKAPSVALRDVNNRWFYKVAKSKR